MFNSHLKLEIKLQYELLTQKDATIKILQGGLDLYKSLIVESKEEVKLLKKEIYELKNQQEINAFNHFKEDPEVYDRTIEEVKNIKVVDFAEIEAFSSLGKAGLAANDAGLALSGVSLNECEQRILGLTDVSELKCSTGLKNILRGLIFKNEDQSFQSIFKLFTKTHVMAQRGLGTKKGLELEKLRELAGLTWSNNKIN